MFRRYFALAALAAGLMISPKFATAQLLAPTITKSFSPSYANYGDVIKLTFVVANPNNVDLANVQFSDTFPDGLVLADNNVSVSCSEMDPSMTTTFSATIDPLRANNTCTITLDVTSTDFQAVFVNTTSTVTSNEAPTGAAATATLYVSPLTFLWYFY